MNEDYKYVSITSTGANTFTCTVAASGGASGSDGAYIPAIKATSVTESACTISSPSNGNIQIHDITLTNGGQRFGTTIMLQLPTDITNGAGGNSNSGNLFPPQVSGFMLHNGTSITPGVEIFGGAGLPSNFNQFKITAINSFSGGDVMVLCKF